MNAIIQSISTRELASAFWLFVFLGYVIANRKTRSALANVVRAFFKPVIVIPLLIAALYAAGEIFLLEHFGIWSVANLKTTILWLVTFAFVTMFELVSDRGLKSSFAKIMRDILSVTGILLFIAELYSFPLAIELAAMPIVTLIALSAEVAKWKPEHAPAAKLLGRMTAIIGFSYAGFSFWKTVQSWREAASWSVASEFFVPVVLSLGFLPFLYGWRVYVAYSSVFSTITIFGIDESLAPYARWLAVTRVRGDLDLLERWCKAIQSKRPSSKAELSHSLTALLALKARETSPPSVPPNDGWSPYLAMQFMADLGVETGHYHHSFDDEWFASSPMREIGDAPILRNNLAYYIEGNENAATVLKIKLNVNEAADAQQAEDMFILFAIHLLEQAVSLDTVERMKSQIAALDVFEAAIPFGSVTLSRENFVGGITGGYSRMFEVRRGGP